MFDIVTLKLNVDPFILSAIKEDITSEDVSTNAVMREGVKGEVELIAKEDGIICGLQVFERVFKLLDEATEVKMFYKDGDSVKNGDKMAVVTGDIRVLLSGERTALNYPITIRLQYPADHRRTERRVIHIRITRKQNHVELIPSP